MRDIQYGLYYAKPGTDERHHIRRGDLPEDLRSLASRANYLLRQFKRKEGTQYRLHGRWATGLEVWEFPFGDHESFQRPDRRLAHARWGDDKLTIEPGVARGLFYDGEGDAR